MIRIPLSVLLAVLMVSGCGRKDTARTDEVPVPVIAETAVVRPLVDYVDTVGTVEPEVSSRIGSILTGRIVLMAKDVGDLVPGQRGEPAVQNPAALLARLDTSVLEAEASRLDAQIKLAEANLWLARKDWERSSQLFKEGSIPESKLDQDRSAFDVASAQAESVSAARHEAQVRIDLSSLYAPIDSVVIEKLANVGDVVNPGQPLYRLVCIRDLKINAILPERDEPAVHAGQEVEITFDALPGHPFTGTIHTVIPSGDRVSHSFIAEIRVRNHTRQGPLPAELPQDLKPDDLLVKPGMFARIKIIKYQKAEAVVVPTECVEEEGNRSFVYMLATSSGPEDAATVYRAKKTPVTTGVTMGTQIEITQGLKSGDRVVGRGIENMTEGQPVRVIQKADESPEASRQPIVSVQP